MEYVLRFTNKGSDDTPILENILRLDWQVAPAEKDAPILHHSKGDVLEHVDNYLPIAKPLAGDERISLQTIRRIARGSPKSATWKGSTPCGTSC